MNIISKHIDEIVIIIILAFFLWLSISIILRDDKNDFLTENGNRCINGFEYFSYERGYSLSLDKTTAKPIRCDKNTSK